MDFGLISAAAASITAAVDISRAAAGLRDSALIAAEVAKINDQLLQAQQALFRHNADLLSLQQQHFETAQKLRKAEEALAERGRYSLFEVGQGNWAYRVNFAPQQGGTSEPGATQTPHYLCQPCFDGGRKSVLAYSTFSGMLECSICKAQVSSEKSGVF